MKTFCNKDEISFLKPLFVFQFIHLSTYFFLIYCCDADKRKTRGTQNGLIG